MANEIALDPSVPGLSEGERFVDIFVAPSKTFKDILRNASWWLPCLLMVVASLATAFAVDRQVGFDQVYLNQVHASSTAEARDSQLTPEQRAMQIKVTKYITYAIPVLLIAGFAFYALILWAAFNFILGAKTTFGQVFATCLYASLPYLLLNVLLIVTLYFGGNAEAYDFKNPAGTNPAYYLHDLAPWLRALLTRIDVIQLWTVGLVVFGMSIIAKKSVAQSAIVVLGWWLVLTILSVGGAVISG